MEKIPALLAEVARLRGSCGASMKAISDQDKALLSMKTTLNLLERENLRLRADNRSLQDLELKLRDTSAENTRLLAIAGEVTALRAGAKSAADERVNLEGQYKKMRKFIRQSVLVNVNNSVGGSTGGSGAWGAGVGTSGGKGVVLGTGAGMGELKSDIPTQFGGSVGAVFGESPTEQDC